MYSVHVVAHLVEALRYRPEGRGFDSDSISAGLWGPGLDSASNINERQEYFQECKGGRCVGLTTLPPSCADFLQIWSSDLLEPSVSRPGKGLLYLYLYLYTSVFTLNMCYLYPSQ